MSYQDMTVTDLFWEVYPKYQVYHDETPAEAWVEAENIMEVRKVISNWYDALKVGTANNKKPDPKGRQLTQEQADFLVQELDSEFDIEVNRGRYIEGVKLDLSTEFFKRLSPVARRAFAQEVRMTCKTYKQIKEEAEKRVTSGEKIPPFNLKEEGAIN